MQCWITEETFEELILLKEKIIMVFLIENFEDNDEGAFIRIDTGEAPYSHRTFAVIPKNQTNNYVDEILWEYAVEETYSSCYLLYGEDIDRAIEDGLSLDDVEIWTIRRKGRSDVGLQDELLTVKYK